MRKSKNRYFYHILVSPWDAPGAITLNVVWMEREFDAYKLSRCMYPSNYNRFWDRVKYLWKKSSFYHTPLHSTPPLGGSRRNTGTPFGMENLKWCRYPMVKKFRRYVYSFWRDPRTWQTDNRTDGRTDDSIDRACIASHGNYTQIEYFTISNCIFNCNFLALVLSEILGGPKITLGGTAPPGCFLAEKFLYPKRVLWHIELRF